MQRSFLDYLVISLKGMAMGAADIVPGVSGGTIAFISGIYEELITSINNVNLSLFKTLKNEGFKAAWHQLNGNFLLALLLGIAISVVSLAKGIGWLLENQPVLLWSFFFGLVLASIYFVGKQIQKWNVAIIIAAILSAALAYYITSLPPLSTEASPWFLLLAGALAICAMILPGISGSFILVLLGAYRTILEAVDNKDLKTIAIVGVGAIVGLLTFSRVLKWLFSNHKNLILAILTGFIFGSLNKIWPWKKVLESITIKDKVITLKEISVLPFNYDGDPKLLFSIILMIVGFATIIILEKVATTPNEN
ncbi:putative membrane protein [Pustulibacterium marinum]|uniref:Putative membrane protein n=1 Tax=Pustulibacterium marinum TaxID=1224947 RepID=A0A1I7G5E8_9FLAO|nr:DUF368 domain-containing protein [Pustulibacterium marinum]SFU43680.1 putative membrane protein [Pustulibacterium marinum]